MLTFAESCWVALFSSRTMRCVALLFSLLWLIQVGTVNGELGVFHVLVVPRREPFCRNKAIPWQHSACLFVPRTFVVCVASFPCSKYIFSCFCPQLALLQITNHLRCSRRVTSGDHNLLLQSYDGPNSNILTTSKF